MVLRFGLIRVRVLGKEDIGNLEFLLACLLVLLGGFGFGFGFFLFWVLFWL